VNGSGEYGDRVEKHFVDTKRDCTEGTFGKHQSSMVFSAGQEYQWFSNVVWSEMSGMDWFCQ
jgi:hypothetical protein